MTCVHSILFECLHSFVPLHTDIHIVLHHGRHLNFVIDQEEKQAKRQAEPTLSDNNLCVHKCLENSLNPNL